MLPRKPGDVVARRTSPLARIQSERHVRGKGGIHPQKLARDREARTIARDQREVVMAPGQGAETLARLIAAEPDALRKLDDTGAGEVAQHPRPHLLLRLVDIAQVAATLDQDRAALAEPSREPSAPVGGRLAFVSDLHPKPIERRERAQPDRRVANVAHVREVDQRDLARRSQRPGQLRPHAITQVPAELRVRVRAHRNPARQSAP